MSPSEFLLRWNERQGLWCYRPAWAPARTDRYSWGRVSSVTALITGATALVVTPLFAVSSKPVMFWVATTTVEFGACAGLCFALASWFCWNRRAARLASVPELPGATRPWPDLGFRRQAAFALLYGALLSLLALLPFHALENARGAWAWRQMRAGLKAKGECFELSCTMPPPARDEDNFFATPFWQQLLYRHELTPDGRGTNIWLDPGAMKAGWGLPDAPGGTKRRGVVTDGHIDLAAWAAQFRSLSTNAGKGRKPVSPTVLPIPAPTGKPATDVLFALGKYEATLTELAGAADRPRSRYPVHYEESLAALLPHLARLKTGARICQLRATARLEAGDAAGAAADVLLGYRLSETTREEPLLISQLVRLACDAITHQALWEGLVAHRWSDAQLVTFQERLSRLDYGPLFLHAFEGERAMGNQFLETLYHASSRAAVLRQIAPSGDGEEEDGSAGDLPLLDFLTPSGWFRRNQIVLLQEYQQYLAEARMSLAPSNRAGLWTTHRRGTELMEAHTSRLRAEVSPFSIMAKILVTDLGRAVAKAERGQTTAQMAVIACALERYHLAHGTYPTTLGELTPAYLAELPMDWMSGEPYHYKLADDGWFRLWSVGRDGEDNGGTTRLGPNPRFNDLPDWPWPAPVPSGDMRLF